MALISVDFLTVFAILNSGFGPEFFYLLLNFSCLSIALLLIWGQPIL